MTVSKEKIKDIDKEEDELKYKKLKHNPDNPNCAHCRYKAAEDSLKDKITKLKDDDTTEYVDKNGVSKTLTFKELEVKRGKQDDVIGWVVKWQ